LNTPDTRIASAKRLKKSASAESLSGQELGHQVHELELKLAEIDQQVRALEARLVRDATNLQSLKTTRVEKAGDLQLLRAQYELASHKIVRPRIVLIVVSEPSHMRFISNVIEKADHIPIEATSSFDALTHLAATPVDLIIADLDMAGSDGLEYVRIVREDLGKEHVPILLLTKASEHRHIVAMAQGLIQGHLVKPVRRDLLMPLVGELLELKAGDGRRAS
jgi:CheY-like chemotaxis protein